ncbi:RusA family crossover junction endodeoxyribonuclease [Rheinheimera sp. MMS21-TC3]|uniref:RusA family crossover junction endodeoxyribonuclease n=1 Tax=Rheinheimera sp. MMS21-TC3 TaxID=3072790 RepID=UPI0028C493CC|nr:RusA family crossover junction endodeoxyribonuclease [Rheinheimera sp. MMS21-TC3]WNO60428.1 RusA family crossover junction endodeoxyribonuclease [Rheinheimera sp. MMS21-TC3]
MINLALPYPPTINSYWRSARVGKGVKVYISDKGQQFRVDTMVAVLRAKANKKLTTRLSVEVHLHAADKRKRDIDNVLKSLLDALGHAGVYIDDSQIDQLTVLRKGNVKGGQCQVFITECAHD